MLTLTNEQKALFALLKGEKTDMSDIDCHVLLDEAEKQAVTLMLQHADGIPSDIQKLWMQKMYLHTAANSRSFYAATEMKHVMEASGHQYIILKGLASASYYPDCYERALGDVDFLIDRTHQAEVEKSLETAGYVKTTKPHYCHVVFRKKHQHLEMHFEIPGIPHGRPGDLVRAYMQDIFDETVEFSMDRESFHTPLPKYHGLILLLHMQHHMFSVGIGLRHLMDWCYFVERTVDDDFWAKDLLPILKGIGLFRFAAVMTKTGSMYLNTVCPKWCEETEDSICDEVMQDIFAGGNFGRKNKARAAGGMMISNHGKEGTHHGKIYNLWHTMIRAIPGIWPVVQQRPALYAVFVPAFMCRRIFRVLTGKRPLLVKSVKYADERKSVYEQLHVFEA